MKLKFKMISLVLLAVIVMVFLYYGNTSVQVSHYTIETDKLSDTSLKVMHLSDFHDYKFNKEKITQILENELPDMVVITGDLIDRRRFDLKHSLDFVALFTEYPIYYVTGNHEGWSGQTDTIVSELEDIGVIVLRNQVDTFIKDGEIIQVVGVDDPVLRNRKSLEFSDELSLLLSHRLSLVKSYKADISFSGHAHGGQVRIFGKGLISPDQGWFPKHTSGVFEYGKTTSVMSRGLGNSVVKLRVFNRPEIVVVTIKNR